MSSTWERFSKKVSETSGSLKAAAVESWEEGMAKSRDKFQEPQKALHPEEVKRRTLLKAWLSPGDDERDEPKLKYEPLPIVDVPLVRLVQLLPGRDWEPIEVIFDTSTLEAEYEALSYFWGNSSDRSPIKCNGYRFDITQNLKSALRDVRRPDTPRILWVDAICINQEDLAEREQQVGIMSDIYRSAKRTVVWLGETFVENDLAFRMVQRMNSLYDENIKDGSMFMTVKREDSKIQLGDPATNPTAEEMAAFYTLLKRSWFSRMWVIQEISLAKEVMLTCGEQEMDWDEFFGGALATFYLNSGGTESQTAAFQGLFKLHVARSAVIGQTSEDLELLELLNSFRGFFASDPRDKLIALFGLTSTDLDEMGLVADYHSSPEDFLINFAKSHFTTSVTLDLLSSPRGISKFSLPSWVPDWSDTSPKPYSLFSRESSSSDEFPITPFNASGPSTSPVPIFGPGNSITFLGHRIALIRTLVDTCPDTCFDWDVMKSKADTVSKYGKGLRDLYKYVYHIAADTAAQRDVFTVWDNTVLGANLENANNVYELTGETLEMAYVRILCGDDMPEGPEAALRSYRKWREERWAFQLIRKAKMDKIKPLHHGLTVIGNFLPNKYEDTAFNAMVETSLRRRFCFTENGYMGLVPQEAQFGDEIWLLKGCRVPLVLRPKDTGVGYELIGDSLIHGVMYGMAYDESKCRQVVIF